MKRSKVTWNDVRESATTFPITSLYVYGIVIILLIQRDVIGVATGIAMLSLIAVLTLFIAITKELRAVHVLVNSQQDALLTRIDQLTSTLNVADIDVPDDPRSKGVPVS